MNVLQIIQIRVSNWKGHRTNWSREIAPTISSKGQYDTVTCILGSVYSVWLKLSQSIKTPKSSKIGYIYINIDFC